MNNYLSDRLAKRASVIKAWLDAKSELGTLLMGEDGPVSRRDVLLVNAIFLFIMAGVLCADSSLLLASVFIAIAGVLVWRLNTLNKKQEHGKRGSYTDQCASRQD